MGVDKGTDVKVVPEDLEFRTGDFSVEEVARAIRLSKNNKAPGPDGCKAEFWKYTSQPQRAKLTQLINRVFRNPEVEPSMYQADLATRFQTNLL